MFSKTMIRKLALCLTILCLLSTPAFAAVDQAGAATLKTLFEDLIAFQKASMNINGSGRLQSDGEVSVELSGTYYAITLPYMKVMLPDDTRFEIGIISINAVPEQKEGAWKMTVALPTPMVMFDKEGTPLTRIAIGQQRAAGLWSEKLQNFYKLDARYQNVTVSGAADSYTMSLPETNLRYDFDFDESGMLSGAGSLSALNTLMTFKADDSALKIGKSAVKFDIDRFNVEHLVNYREHIKTLAEHKSDITQSPERLEGFYNMLYDFVLTSSNGVKTTYLIEDFEITSPEKSESFSIKNINLGLNMAGFLEDAVDLTLRLGVEDVKPELAYDEKEDVIPHSIKLDWQLQDIPFKQIADISKNTAIASINQPNMAGIAALSLMVKIPALMAAAGTQLEIKDNYIAGPDFKITLDGLAKADISAVNSMSIDATALFEGLDILLGRLERLSETIDDDKDREDLQDAIAQLQAVRNLGTPDKSESENPAYRFRFEVLPDGKILLNGQDFFMVMKDFSGDGDGDGEDQDAKKDKVPTKGTQEVKPQPADTDDLEENPI